MTKQNLGSRVSLAGKLKSRRSWWLVAAGAVALAVFSVSIANAGGSPPNGMETPEPPTETPEPGAMIFVGDIAVTEAGVCGGGTITFTLTPGDPGDGIAKVVVAETFVLSAAQNLTIEFDPPIAIASDGSFSNTGALPEPFAQINATLAGTFDFSADPATVAGTLTVGDPAAPLCEADYTAEALAAGEEPPTPAPPVPTVAAAPAALPVTGASVIPGTGANGVFWAVLAGIVAVLALGAGGAVAVRRRGT